MAGRFGCATVNDAMAAEEVVPGVAPAVMRSVRAAHAARLEADRRAREAQARAITAPQRRPQYYPQQPQVAAAAPPPPPPPSQPPAGPSQHQQLSQQQQQQQYQQQPTDPRQRYPCHLCGVRGHWRADNACRPEDVRANLARLAAMIPAGQLALPAPADAGMSRSNIAVTY